MSRRLLGSLYLARKSSRGAGSCVACSEPLETGAVYAVVVRFFGLSKHSKSRWASAKLHIGCIGDWAASFGIEDKRHSNNNPTGRTGRPMKALATLSDELKLERRKLSKRYMYLLRQWIVEDNKQDLASQEKKDRIREEVKSVAKKIEAILPITPHQTKFTAEEGERITKGIWRS